MYPRQAGILCHVTSLPGRFGQGTFGAQARSFIDILSDTGFALWQILPLNPPNLEGSPYQSCSSRAIHAGFIDFDDLVPFGFERVESVVSNSGRLDFEAVKAHRRRHLPAVTTWLWSDRAPSDLKQRAEAFFDQQTWLGDFTTFQAIAETMQDELPWWRWPDPLRRRNVEAIRHAADPKRIRAVMTEQFLAYDQWQRLHNYAAERNVRVVGDLPIYVAANSADTWADPGQFLLSPSEGPAAVAGVPPDYFAENGQLWGNPLYDWAAMAGDGYRWWAERLAQAADLFDVVRIDHFRAFSRYWSIPADAESARDGAWVEGPGKGVFQATSQAYKGLEIIAEDLGDIDEQVVALRDSLGFPGMRVVQFAFDGNPDNPHAPYNHTENSVCYLGTHDNPTTMGWLATQNPDSRSFILRTLGLSEDTSDDDARLALIKTTLASRSKYAFVTLQDAMGKGDEAIMNRPGEPDGNWQWRLGEDEDIGAALRAMRPELDATGR